MVKRGLFFTILVGMLPVAALASNSGITYQGRILKPDGSPLTGAAVQFKMQIRTPDSNNCLMYEELQTLDLRNTSGQFSLTINDGSGARMDSTGFGLDRIFANRGSFAFNPTTCSSGSTYAPNEGDGRNLVVLFKDETMASWEPVPAQKINFVPFAFETKQVQGFGADSLLRVVNAGGDPLTGVSPLSNAQYTALLDLLNGSSAAYTKAGQLNGVALPTMTSGEVLGWNGSTWVSQAATSGPNSITTTMIQNGAVSGTKLDPAISISTSGTIASAITTTRDFKIYNATNQYVEMVANNAITGTTDVDGHVFYKLTWPAGAASTNGQVLTSDTSGNLSWSALPTALPPTGTAGGDLTGTYPNPTIAANAVVTAKINDGAVTTLKLGDKSVTYAKIQDVTTGKLLGRSTAGPGSVEELSIGSGLSLSGGTLSSTNVSSQWTTHGSDISYDGVGNVGIGTTAPSALLDVAGAIRIAGSGSETCDATHYVGGIRYNGGNIQYCDSTSWKTLGVAGAGLTALTGDVTASGTGSVAATVASVGGSTAAQVHQSQLDTAAATSVNTPSTIVKRDASGNFSATDITASSVQADTLKLNNAGSILNIVNPIAGAWTLTLPSGAGATGQILTTNGLGVTSWSSLPTALPPTGSAGGDLTGTYPNPTIAANAVVTSKINDKSVTYAKIQDVTTGKLLGRSTAGPGSAEELSIGSGLSLSGGTLSSTNVSSQWTTHGSDISYDGAGNVGIGTAAPLAKLDINGGGLHIQNGSAYGALLGDTSAGDFYLSTGGAPRIYVKSSGRVGIGTAAPPGFFAVAPTQYSTGSALQSGTTITGTGTSWTSALVGSEFVFSNGTSAGTILSVAGANSLTVSTSQSSAGPYKILYAGLQVDGSGNVGIGTTAPSALLDVAGAIRIAGSGSETCDATHYVGGIRYNGGNIQYCDSTSWKTLGVAGAGLTALTGDVTASGTGSVAATVASVGGVTAANVALGANAANAATDANNPSTIVKRDASGGFAAGAISGASATFTGSVTQGSSVYKDTGSNTVTVQAPPTVTAPYILKWPTSAGGSGEVLSTDASGNMSWSALPTALPPTGTAGGDLTGTYPNPSVATVGTSTAANIHSAELLANAATDANTSNAIVKRDGTGNFTANVATLNGVALKNAGSIVNLVNPPGAAYTLTLPTGLGTSGQVLSTNGSGVTSWTTAVTSATGFVQGGNTFGVNADLGTNDAYDLNLRTGGTTKMTVTSTGNVGIGTTSPGANLDVVTGVNPMIRAKVQSGGSPYASFLIAENEVVNHKAILSMFSPTASSSGPIQPDGAWLDANGAGGLSISSFNSSAPIRIFTGGYADANEHMRITSAGNVGIGTTAPLTKLEVAGSLRVGDGGETCDTSLTGAIRYNGGNLQFCAGSMPWTTLGVAGSGISSLTGDVTATGPGAAAAAVAFVGGSAAADIHQSQLDTAAATSANAPSTLVKRDGSGNFSAGAISATSVTSTGAVTAGSVVYKDSTSNTVTILAPTTVTSSYVLKWPTSAGGSDDVLKTDASGQLSWTSLPTALPPNGAAGGDLSGTYPDPTIATVGGSTAANINSAELLANAATAANTSNAIVKRDATGNFAANIATVNGLALNNAGSVLNVVNPIGAAYTLTLPVSGGTNGYALTTDGTGKTSWSPVATSATGFMNGGNSFGANADLGTNDGFDLNFRTGGTTQMTVTSGGNVGIGTTAPTQPLDLVGQMIAADSRADATIKKFHLLIPSYLTSSPDMAVFSALAKSMTREVQIGAPHTSGSINGPSRIGFFTQTTFGAPTSNTERMTIDSSGNVGIGTTNPSKTLGVVGSGIISQGTSGGIYHALKIENTSGAASDRGVDLTFGAGSSDAGAITAASNDGTGTNAYMSFATRTSAAVTEKMRIDSSGNVGIGTTEPWGDLDVSNGTVRTGVLNSASSGSIGTLSTHNLNLMTDSADVMTLTTTGNVGIGTTSPGYRLEVAGTLRTGNAVIGGTGGMSPALKLLNTAALSADQGNSITFQNGPTVNMAQIKGAQTGASNTDGYLTFDTRTAATVTEKMRIDNVGNVGIGTTAPSEKLEVVGNVKATSFISTSDRRLKKDIAPVSGLDAILRLNGVSWHWKTTNQSDMGVIAQEVERVFPQSVVTDPKTGFKAVKYNSLIAPLIESTKELYGMCKASEERDHDQDRAIASLAEENRKLKDEVTDLKRRLENIEKLLNSGK